MEHNHRYKEARKATLISVLVNFLLGLSKVVGGFVFRSHGLVADGIHSFSDLLTDAMVLFASKYGSQDADKDHPYGHQRIETAATLFLSMLLIIAGAGISWDAIDTFIDKDHIIPNWLSLPIIIVSLVANEALFHYTRYVGKKINSELLITNAWHHRSDAASSLVVLVGLVGSLMGYIYFDALAAILVGLLIIKMGWDYGWNSVKELVDTAVEPEVLEKIKQSILSVNGIDKIHQLRTRLMGGDIYVDVHILVNPFLSVSEGHYIAQHVHQRLVHDIKNVKDVTVHVDPEDDEICCPSIHLPNRKQLHQLFLSELKQEFLEINHEIIHYHDGKLLIDLITSEPVFQKISLNKKLKRIKNTYQDIKEIRVLSLNHYDT